MYLSLFLKINSLRISSLYFKNIFQIHSTLQYKDYQNNFFDLENYHHEMWFYHFFYSLNKKSFF